MTVRVIKRILGKKRLLEYNAEDRMWRLVNYSDRRETGLFCGLPYSELKDAKFLQSIRVRTNI